MLNAQNRNRKNEMFDCWKMIAAFFVVCIHYEFPGAFGDLTTCMGRFAVPMFFAISGFFSYGITAEKAAGRGVRLLKINGVCIILSFLRALCDNWQYGGNVLERWRAMIPSFDSLTRWLFLHLNPFGGHLWYLTAIVLCYGILWIYIRFWGKDRIDYRPLYLTGMILMIVEFALGNQLRIVVESIPYYLFRNGWFIGIPMFVMGIFLREHHQRIIENFRMSTFKIVLLFLVGSVLSAMETKTFGERELPLGTILQVITLILFAQMHPVLSGNSRIAQKMFQSFGFLALSIYVLHLHVGGLYISFCMNPLIEVLGETAESWLRSILIYGLSLGVSILIRGIIQGSRRVFCRQTA